MKEMKKIITSIAVLLVSVQLSAQSITGTWKRTGNMLEDVDGKKTELQKIMLQSSPCIASIKYMFTANGKHTVQAPANCMSGIEEMSKATWKMQGKKLIITTINNPVSTTDYTLVFTGNTMVMTHLYTDAERKQSGIKTNKIIITYQRL
jgi:Lipocalin-like domain